MCRVRGCAVFCAVSYKTMLKIHDLQDRLVRGIHCILAYLYRKKGKYSFVCAVESYSRNHYYAPYYQVIYEEGVQ
jgi:hypothetical protein